MTTLYMNDTRDSYVERAKAIQLSIAERHYQLGNDLSMWLHLFTWVQCEEIYGTHWDKIRGKI